MLAGAADRDVGEIRDLATAEMAVQAALTGHLVFSTLHTNDAPSAVTRLMELGIPAYLINATLLGVLAQRLVRTLCEQCKAPDAALTRETVGDMVAPWQISGGFKPYRPVGCSMCNNGYKGRVGIYQVMPISDEMRQLIMRNCTQLDIAEQALKEGVKDLRQSGLVKVKQGVTSLEEIEAITNE